MRLRVIREAKALTQIQLEELSGVPQPVIASLERLVKPNPTWDTVARLSYALGERPEDIFGLPLPFVGRRRAALSVPMPRPRTTRPGVGARRRVIARIDRNGMRDGRRLPRRVSRRVARKRAR